MTNIKAISAGDAPLSVEPWGGYSVGGFWLGSYTSGSSGVVQRVLFQVNTNPALHLQRYKDSSYPVMSISALSAHSHISDVGTLRTKFSV